MVVQEGIGDRVNSQLDAIGSIGKDSRGGWTRLAFSPEEQEVHNYAANQLAEAGFAVRTDPFLNIIASKGQSRKRVMMGTHLDTVIQGGNYDGVVGFIAALEAARELNENQGIDIVIFRAEESPRFSKACLGSSAAFGFLSQNDASAIKCTITGSTLEQVLARRGGDPSKLGKPTINPADYCAYFEVHIEQAPLLDSKNYPLGIVTSIRAPIRHEIRLEGLGCVTAASSMIIDLESRAISAESKGSDIVATVGKIDGFFTVSPGNINTIPETAGFRISSPMEDILSRVCSARGMKYELKPAPEGVEVAITGKANHSGGTPMIGRKDALTAAAQIYCDYSLANPYLQVAQTNVTFYTDIRSNNLLARESFQQDITDSYKRLADAHGLGINSRETEKSNPAPSLDKGLQSLLKSSADELGINKTIFLPSGAGHDALKVYQAGIPTAMLFTPSYDGRSHCTQEYTHTEHISGAVNVLERTLKKLCA